MKNPKPVILDSVICIDRSVRPPYLMYPDTTIELKTFLHPEFECSGPAMYDISKNVYPWLHDIQGAGIVPGYEVQDGMDSVCFAHEGLTVGAVKGQIIYDHLKSTNALDSCLNLQDGFAIQRKGLAFFLKYFPYLGTFHLWKSIYDDGISVPCLFVGKNEIGVGLAEINQAKTFQDPSLRFKFDSGFNS